MPTSYLFQLNLDLSIRKSDPHFTVDFPAYSWDITDSNFIEQCIPSGFLKIEECFQNLFNGKIDIINEDCNLRNQLDQQLFLPIQLIATLHRNEKGTAEYFQCSFTFLEKLDGKNDSDAIDSLFKYNPQSFCYLGLTGEVIRVNQRLCDFLNIPESILIRQNFRDFIQTKDLADAELIFKDAINGHTIQYDFPVYVNNNVEKRVRINFFPRFIEGKVIGVYGIFEDITESLETEQRWKVLVEQNPLPVVVFIDLKFVFTNSSAAQFYGVKNAQELIGLDLIVFVPESDHELLLQREKQLLNNEILEPREAVILSRDGTKRHIIVHARGINFEGKKAVQSVLFDITEFKKQRDLIKKSLHEKETLLKEIHHRVKNNLAIISGLLELQIQTIKDKGTISALRDSQNRIQSIALVHQQLYQFESLDEINLEVYLSDLIEGLKLTFENSIEIDFQIYSEDIRISIEHAIPCSLIVNEVMINAFKHAFDGITNPKLEIKIKKKGTNVELTVCDNGIGLGKNNSSSIRPSLGTTLVEILTQQLDGSSNYFDGPTNGTCFRLTFPLS